MTTKKINICGKDVTVAYCYATEIAFRKYTDVTIEKFDATNPEHVMYVILAAAVAYAQSKGEDEKLQAEDLLYNASPEELVSAVTEIFHLRAQWYKVPTGEEDPQETEVKEKND